jgi:hypothetical protein
MKRILSLFLTLILAATCSTAASADALQPEITYYEWTLLNQYQITSEQSPYLDFCIVYCHPHNDYDRDFCLPDVQPYEYDWVLVQAMRTDLAYCEVLYPGIVGGRLLTAPAYPFSPFIFTYGIYDAEQDRYFDVSEIDFDDYDGLYRVWQHLTDECFNLFTLVDVGDPDGDSLVTIMDATSIQRVLAGYCKIYDIVATAADVDNDIMVTVLDATRIQRCLAGLCTLDDSENTRDKSTPDEP